MQKKEGDISSVKEVVYFVRGMHCASCGTLIEKKLLEIKGIKSVEASTAKGKILIEYEGEKTNLKKLNDLFRNEGYVFSEKPESAKNNKKGKISPFIFLIPALIIVGFLFLNKFGLSELINISSKSSLPTFFAFGVMAGISTCAALIGGIVLSMSKQWSELYPEKNSSLSKFQPHLMFNSGRLVSYALLGAILGEIGSRLQISFKFTAFLVIAISLMMLFLALQMLGVKYFRKFQIIMPKFVLRYVANESNFKGKYMPFFMGALTFFLPCGFTITSQSLALVSGNMLQGGLIMFSFALGTMPSLLVIGLSSAKFFSKPHLSYKFSKIAGILIIFFAIYNINSQLNVLGLTSLSDFMKKVSGDNQTTQNAEEGFAPIVNGKQILKMDASSSGYKPNYFTVKSGIPVRWEITDKGTSGCTNVVISQGLFSGQINLTPGQVSIKEFTPTKPGKYKFSCWMGMVSGVIEVTDENSSPGNPAGNLYNSSPEISPFISSGVNGCGCGCGSGSN